MLTISVKNFGPIAEGSVDLKPLTIFVGPSNTGKSYMATAVYALAQAQEIGPMYWGRRPSMGLAMSHRRIDTSKGFGEVVGDFREWIPKEADLSELTVSSLPAKVRSWLEGAVLKEWIFFRDQVIDQLHQIHGRPVDFVKQGNESRDFYLSFSQDSPWLKLEVRLTDSPNPLPQFDISQVELPWSDLMQTLLLLEKDGEDFDFFPKYLVGLVPESVISGLPPKSYYLPAARSGIVQAQKVLASALVRQASFAGIRELNVPTMAGVTTEFLSKLISLERRMGREQSDNFEKAIAFIETQVLQGQIDLDESAGLPYPEVAYESAAGKFPLEHTSSMVSELAPLILFLRYLIRPGDLLILEEPESHLHPAAQLQLARGIARLVNAGVKVLITTHSADFTGQINNLISMSNSSNETWKSLGLEQEECLQPEQVSAYGFRFDSGMGGAVTYPLPVGSDVGIEDEEFLPVIELLYHQALELQDTRLT